MKIGLVTTKMSKRPRGYLRERVEKLLKDNIPARERHNRPRAICMEIAKTYPDVLKIPPEVFLASIKMGIALDRMFRDVQLKDKELRGNDYGDKEELEQNYQIELGYEPQIKLKIWEEK